MTYTALKPCRVGGHAFRIGETVPKELIAPGAEKNLLKMGILAATEPAPGAADADVPEALNIRVPVEEGELPLTITKEGLEAAVLAVTSSADDAKRVAAGMADRDALILLDLLDPRKSVQEAAKARAQELEA